MIGRSNPSKSFTTPGPGNYEIRSDKSMEIPSYKFGKESRDKSIPKEAIQKPGPGMYSTSEPLGKSAQMFSFGKELRADRGRPMTPGPGQYQAKVYVGKEAPKITMSSRPQTSKIQRIPGPGQYDSHMNNKLNPPSFRIGSEKREVFKCLQTNPGPAQYSPQNNVISTRPKSPNWKIGSSQREWSGDISANPGPGNYNTSRGLGEGPKVKINFNIV